MIPETTTNAMVAGIVIYLERANNKNRSAKGTRMKISNSLASILELALGLNHSSKMWRSWTGKSGTLNHFTYYVAQFRGRIVLGNRNSY